VQGLPREQMVKAQTLGASTWQVAIRVVLPQIMPRLIKSVRLDAGPAFLFLISAEAIAADVGLGYRIFWCGRYLSMDVILLMSPGSRCSAFALGHVARLFAAQGFPLGYVEEPALMSALSFRNVWVEYGSQIVLERIQHRDRVRQLCFGGGPLGRRQEHLPAADLGQERPSQGAVLLDGEPVPAEPAPTAASCSSAIRCFRISPYLARAGQPRVRAAAVSRRGFSVPPARAIRKERSH